MFLNILITGANGFVGKALTKEFLNAGYFVRGAVLALPQHPFIEHKNFELITIGKINSQTNWSEALKNIDIVIHTAARVHMMKENPSEAMREHNVVNNLGSIHLFEEALKVNVKKFIFLSTINVFVNEKHYKTNNLFFDAHSKPDPDEPYRERHQIYRPGICRIKG